MVGKTTPSRVIKPWLNQKASLTTKNQLNHEGKKPIKPFQPFLDRFGHFGRFSRFSYVFAPIDTQLMDTQAIGTSISESALNRKFRILMRILN